MYYKQVEFILGCKSGSILKKIYQNNPPYLQEKEKESNNHINWFRKSIWQIHHPFMISKIVRSMKSQRNRNTQQLLQVDKEHLQKPTGNNILNIKGKRVNDSTLRSGSRQECLLQPVLFNIVLEVRASAIKWQVEIKDMDYKARNKIILFAMTWLSM